MALLTEYSSTLTRLLAAPPAPGEGHRWMFRVAVHLRRYHTKQAVFLFLRQACSHWAHRTPPDREIAVAVANAFSFESDGLPSAGPVDWFTPDPARIAAVVASTPPLFAPGDRTGIGAPAALQALFQPADLVCLASNQANAFIMPAAEALAMVDAAQFIVPSPMLAACGTNKQGKTSTRCNANTGRRRFLVLECDGADKPTQAAVLSHLAGILPLVLAVDSAGKSIHGWFRCEGADEYTLRDFMSYAVGLGADPHTWTRSQLVRCPGGTRYRESGETARQEIVFWSTK